MHPDNQTTTDRACTRIPKGLHLEIRKLEYPLPKEVAEIATSRNIAQRGICLVSPRRYEPGDLLSISMTLNGWQRFRKGLAAILNDELARTDVLTVIAEVIWCSESGNAGGYDTGVKFINVYEDDMIALDKYFSSIIPYD